jgi:GDPmannose 4,6-dehydratase
VPTLPNSLLDKGYTVYGTYRRTSSVNFWRIEELGIQNHPNLHLVEYDLTDSGASIDLVQKVEPVEIYNLAAQSFVGVSFDQPSTTAQITGIGWPQPARSYSLGQHQDPLLPSLNQRDVWQSASHPAN